MQVGKVIQNQAGGMQQVKSELVQGEGFVDLLQVLMASQMAMNQGQLQSLDNSMLGGSKQEEINPGEVMSADMLEGNEQDASVMTLIPQLDSQSKNEVDLAENLYNLSMVDLMTVNQVITTSSDKVAVMSENSVPILEGDVTEAALLQNIADDKHLVDEINSSQNQEVVKNYTDDKVAINTVKVLKHAGKDSEANYLASAEKAKALDQQVATNHQTPLKAENGLEQINKPLSRQQPLTNSQDLSANTWKQPTDVPQPVTVSAAYSRQGLNLQDSINTVDQYIVKSNSLTQELVNKVNISQLPVNQQTDLGNEFAQQNQSLPGGKPEVTTSVKGSEVQLEADLQFGQETLSNTGAKLQEYTSTQVANREIPVTQLPSRISEMVRAMMVQQNPGQTTIKMKLQPEHLGEVTVKLTWTKGELSAQFITATGLAKEALEAAFPQLKELLAQQDIRLSEAAVFMGQQSDQWGQENTRQWEKKQMSKNKAPRGYQIESVVNTAQINAGTALNSTDGVNMLV